MKENGFSALLILPSSIHECLLLPYDDSMEELAESIKRKDSKGRSLREGEQQRKDGRYMYTYTDPSDTKKKKHHVYSWKLERNDKTPAGKKIDLSLVRKKN